ncbi:hypothetical protein [Nocardia sp. NPDC049149]|uniref:hypothetical protein n=1 Tax=Nocardia sp. NPDC049149 TaxID=3364315 RepID=UPI00371CD758
MRGLIMASAPLDLGVLWDVLDSRDVDAERTSDLGAGIDLLRVPPDDFDFGIAVVPAEQPTNSGVRAAIFLEIGIAAARNIPVLVIIDPDEPPLPALGDLSQVRAAVDNREALELHVGLFLKRFTRKRSKSDSWDPYESERSRHNPRVVAGPSKTSTAEIRRRLNEFFASMDSSSWSKFREVETAELLDVVLQAEGATVAREIRDADQTVDIAFTHPDIGETVLIEIKKIKHAGDLDSAQEQLSSYVKNNSHAIGLVLYDGPQMTSSMDTFSRYSQIWTMSLREFYTSVAREQLGPFLIRTRNQLVHHP